MDLRFTPEQERFRQEVREFIQSNMTPELQEEIEHGEPLGPHGRQMYKKLCARGWVGMGWPKEYGGQAADLTDQFIFEEEASRFAVYVGDLTVAGMGPVIMQVGSEEQKRHFLPGILRGDTIFAIGYTEPSGGSDLASLQTRAVQDGDDYVINGQKMFTTEAHVASHVWLLARTDPEQRKHRGLSIFLIPMNTPGIAVRPLWGIGGGRTNEVFLDNVRVPKTWMLGESNMGWYVAAMALNLERSGAARYVRYVRPYESLLQFVREARYDGYSLAEDPAVRQMMAELAIDIRVARLLAYRSFSLVKSGNVNPAYEHSAFKTWGSELSQRIAGVGLKVMGMYGQLEPGSRWAPLKGMFERLYQRTVPNTIGHGTSQINRNVIATRGLGLPR
ncbi:MAG: acyl-CoA dehydrogenase family protein [Chloroflexi bacterium]|nr:acyl-CoA dehydrogenase family protein [Chloroflexota bacterium]